jgi:hypothetical protein
MKIGVFGQGWWRDACLDAGHEVVDLKPASGNGTDIDCKVGVTVAGEPSVNTVNA